MLVLASNVQVDTWSYSYCLDSRAGSGGPRAPRHAIWPGPPILATYNSSQSVKPLHQVIGGFSKTDHGLLFPQHIQYRIAPLVWRYIAGLAPSYLRELYRLLSSCAAGHRNMRSSVQGDMAVSWVLFATMQSSSFSVIGPTTWNGLPSDLRHLPNCACAHPVSTGIGPQSLPEWAFRARPGLGRICLFPKVAQIAEHKFANR